MAIYARRKKLSVVELPDFAIVTERSAAAHPWMILDHQAISAWDALGYVLDERKLVGAERSANVDGELRLYVQGEIDLLGPGNPSLEHCGLTDHVPDDPE